MKTKKKERKKSKISLQRKSTKWFVCFCLMIVIVSAWTTKSTGERVEAAGWDAESTQIAATMTDAKTLAGANETSTIETITSTPGHPYYVEAEGRFVDACELAVGTELTLADGRKAIVENVVTEKLEEPVKVYNFEVADFHTYYVGENSVLVHNTGCEPEADGEVNNGGSQRRTAPSGGHGEEPDAQRVYTGQNVPRNSTTQEAPTPVSPRQDGTDREVALQITTERGPAANTIPRPDDLSLDGATTLEELQAKMDRAMEVSQLLEQDVMEELELLYAHEIDEWLLRSPRGQRELDEREDEIRKLKKDFIEEKAWLERRYREQREKLKREFWNKYSEIQKNITKR